MTENNTFLKPLDGSPLMSANCWQTVLNALDERLDQEESVRCLEWGAGNSTISLVRTGLSAHKPFEFESIDHDTRFFPYLAESIVSEFKKVKDISEIKLVWKSLPQVSTRGVGDVIKRHNLFKSATIDSQLLFGNKRIQYAEKFRPNFRLSFKSLLKFILITLTYFIWIFFKRQTKKVEAKILDPKQSFEDFFKEGKPKGCLSITSGSVSVNLWHIPEISSMLWNKGVLFDGSIRQLPEYVDVPLSGTFDLVFIDGRARVSCIKRTYHDRLLKEKGYLFVHDAYRSEMLEAFLLFTPTSTFIYGQNTTLNGSVRCLDDYGFPLVRAGDTIENTKLQINQELFVYQN